MDVGIFTRGRFIFWCWILLPALLVGGAQCAVYLYGRLTAEALENRRTSMAVVPELKRKVAAVDLLMKRLAPGRSGEMPTIEVLSTRVNDCAQRFGFSLNLLVFHPPKVESGDTLPAVKVEVEGEGALVPLLSWLDEMQRPEHLLILDTASVRLVQAAPAPVYGVKLLFRFYVFPGLDPPGRTTP